MLLATKVLVCFLRGLLTNLDTPPVTSDIRSILVRPLIVKDGPSQSSDTLLFVVPSPGQAWAPPTGMAPLGGAHLRPGVLLPRLTRSIYQYTYALQEFAITKWKLVHVGHEKPVVLQVQ